MKRKVVVRSIGMDGVTLEVVFSPKPSLWPNLTTKYASMGGGPDNNTLLVVSPPFKDAQQASHWLDQFTMEVKALVQDDKFKLDQFRELEGEKEV